MVLIMFMLFFFFKQKTAYEITTGDWSSDVCSSDLAERAVVPHHLIDIIEPSEAYSAARFVVDAQRLIAEIHARGHLPLLVGGTMLYFKALFEGLDAMPAADRAVRAALEAQCEREGLVSLYREL